ncbi:hypothetical protein [Zoogloea sp.]|jgi:hypothetical protein|uniref:hypothetical protein n=1 Tax=Zoogloea sp. TaxID=49181 RepID=UPI001B4748B6|nr:hypothetical protein [Zoogloea sp.]MBK6652793.1 hypothetical protein [Zoogloea sp.]MBK7848268.1 hypothetical protein [Zoogloea sp.]MBP7445440.1 hypothetical protein [Zoogloea sp.]HOY01906.1 hypothetical protein [Zoogloea sp.]HPI60610.1 hypothetical protein [Zoogloea sp.]
MVDGLALWKQLLQVQEPWVVQACRADEFNRCMAVWIGVEAPRSWFGLGRPRVVEGGAEATWRHTGFGGWRVQVHVRVPVGSELPRHSWAGEAGMPFTRALDRQILSLLNEGVGMSGVCSILDLPMTDLWRYRYALDHGRHAVGAADAVPMPASPAEAAVPPALMAFSRVPNLEDPVWVRLLDGSVKLDVRVLGLQLLLSRTRSQVAVIADEEVRMMKLRELHRYFVKNERMLAHELHQLVSEAA